MQLSCDVEGTDHSWYRMELGGGSFGADERPLGFLYSESSRLVSRVSMPGFLSVFVRLRPSIFVTEVSVFVVIVVI